MQSVKSLEAKLVGQGGEGVGKYLLKNELLLQEGSRYYQISHR